MFIKKFIPLALATGALALGLSNSADARHKYGHRFKHGTPSCHQVVQVVRIGHHFTLKNYGRACSRYGGHYKIASRHPHPRRIGKDLYIWKHGRLVTFHEGPRETKHKPCHDHERYRW